MPDLSFTDESFVRALVFIAILIPSVMFHEVSHGFIADKLGDPTARNAGRLTLNPIAHVDPFGSVILPGLMAIAGGPLFGWAKPVPVNPSRFSKPTAHMALTALAGPGSNLLLAAVLARVAWPSLSGIPQEIVALLIVINVFLAVFNMLPIPPLDGSRLLPLVLSAKGQQIYWQSQQYGFLLLFALVFLFPSSLSFMTDITGWILEIIVP